MSRSTVQENVGEITHKEYTSSFEWKIRDYCKIPQEVDSRLESPNIKCLDAVWCLQLYPNGQSEEQSEGWMGLYLMMKESITGKHWINYTLGLKTQAGINVVSKSYTSEFEGDGNYWGWENFFQASELQQERNTISLDGTLTVFCIISTNGIKGVHAAVQTDISPTLEKLGLDFKHLMLNEEASDVTLEVKNRKFRAHSAVLVARSSVFAAMLKHEMKEKNSGVVEINDCDPDAFQVYLEYLYSGDVQQISTDTVFELHAIVDKYDSEELKTICVQFMMDTLSIETVCDVLAVSLMHNESVMLEKVVMFVGRNLKEILITVKWQSFVKENPIQANELYLKALDYYEKPE